MPVPYFSFVVGSNDVVPQPYPSEFGYWYIGDRQTDHGVEYRLVAQVHTTQQILQHWPQARTIQVHEDSPTRIYAKQMPTGNEQGNIRLKFNYPEDAVTPSPVFDGVPSWRSRGGKGFLTWVTIVESMAQFKELWPKAWGVSVVAERVVVG